VATLPLRSAEIEGTGRGISGEWMKPSFLKKLWLTKYKPKGCRNTGEEMERVINEAGIC
jgi:hypothetical protein